MAIPILMELLYSMHCRLTIVGLCSLDYDLRRVYGTLQLYRAVPAQSHTSYLSAPS